MDDVLANYKEGFISVVNITGVRKLKPDHRFTEWDLSKSLGLNEEEDNKVYSLINMPGFASMLNPCPGAVEGVQAIMEVADVQFVTSPLKTSPTWAYDRMVWLQKYFGEEQGVKITSTHEKYMVDGDFLCDDKPEHCTQWQAAHPMGVAILWLTQQNLRMAPRDILGLAEWGMVKEIVAGRAQLMKKLAT